MDEIYAYALKLLRTRDYTVAGLTEKLETKFGTAPAELIQNLVQKKFLDDRRFAQNYAAKSSNRGAARLREELASKGVPPELTEEILSQTDWPSLHEALTARMKIWKLHPPLKPRDAARLFRALLRLGYDEDAIREEIERLT